MRSHRSPTWAVAAALGVGSAIGATCAPVDSTAYVTRTRGALIVAELRAMQESAIALPQSSEALCPRLANCWGASAPEDGWSRRFLLRVVDSAYHLISAGADGIVGTQDDIDFSPGARESRVRALAGCWVRVPEAAGGRGLDRLWLDSSATAGGEFAVVGEGSAGGNWTPWTLDSLRITIMQSTRPVEVVVHQFGDRLTGVIAHRPVGSLLGRVERRRVEYRFDSSRRRDQCVASRDAR